jgi:hypothetical protein
MYPFVLCNESIQPSMKPEFIPSPSIKSIKKWLCYLSFFFFFGVQNLVAQSTIFSTNFGTTAVNTDPLLVGGGVTWNRAGTQPGNTQLTTSSASSGGPFYGGILTASAGANGGDNGTTLFGAGVEAILTASGINTTGFTSIQVGYLARASSASYIATVTFEWSNDGTTWNPITYTNVTYNGTWQPVNGGTLISLPAGAQNQANLRLRWQFDRTNGSGNYRIDDLIVRGVSATPNISVSGSISGLFTSQGTPSSSASYTVSGSNLTVDLVITAPAGFELKTGVGAFGPSLNLTPVSGTISLTTIDVRLTGASAGTFSGNITHVSAPATSQNVSADGQVIAAPVTFGSSNIVVARVGTGAALSNAATRILIDEYTTTGTLVQSVTMPTAVSGLNRILTLSGTATSDGSLNLSPDGQYLTLTGYDAALGTASVTGTASALTNRIVGVVYGNGSVNTTTRINDKFSANNIRSAVTNDGTNFWCAGANDGTVYVPLGNTAASTAVSTTVTNTRVASVFGSQLYFSSGSGTRGIYKVGAGLPTNTGNTATVFASSGSDPYGYAFLDRDATAGASFGGLDVIYVANGSGTGGGGLAKWYFDGTNWIAAGSITGTFSGICGRVIGANAELFVTVGGNQVYKVIDTAPYNSAITGDGTAITAAGTLIITAAPNTALRGVQFAPVTLPTPDIDHTFTTPGGINIAQGSSDVAIYQIQLDVATANATLTGISVSTAGTYAAADFSGFKLRYSNDATLTSGDPILASISTSTGPGQVLNFNSLGQLVPIGTRYLFVTADVAGTCAATIGNSLNISVTPLANITYTMSNKTGTPAAGTSKTIISGLPQNVSNAAVTNNLPTLTVSWTNPSCLDNVIIVAHTSPITSSPLLTTYTFNNNYAIAPAFPGGGKVVYQGSTTGQVISGLTVGTVYYFKIFTRSGASWSTGVQVSGLANEITFFSRGSGSANTGAIWALTPGGTPATAASLGGFATDKNIRVQSGDIVEITASGINCLKVIVDNGGTLWRNNATTGSMAYFNVYGDIVCNGTIGNGATFDAIGFNMEGAIVSISGTGAFDAGRIRKNTASPNTTTQLTFTKNVSNIRFFGGAALYNNADNTQFNVILPAGKILNIPAADGDVAIDGTDGTTVGERGGSWSISGTMNVGGRIFARTNNATQACAIAIQATGRIFTGNVTADVSSAIGFPFTINTGGKLLVSKILLVSNGNLDSNNGIVLLSTGNATALIDGTGLGNVTGNVTVQRKVGSTTGFHYLSSPVGDAFVGNNTTGWSDDFLISSVWDNFAYNPTVTNFTSFPQVWEYNESDPNSNPGFGWIGATSSADPLTPLKGFACVVPANAMVDVFGPVNNGIINYSVTANSDGLNLIGNPYPSPISWNAFRAHNPALSATYQAFITSGGYAGNYGTFNGTVGTLGVGNIIASSQGIFVTAVSSGSISALNADRTTDLAPTFFTQTQVKDLARIELNAGQSKDEAVVYFDDNASDNFESIDGLKIQSLEQGISSLWSYSDGKNLSINALGSFSSEKIIPINIKAASNGNYTISITDISTFSASAMIYLVDAETGVEQNVRMNPEMQVALTAGQIENRFFLRFVPGVKISTEAAQCGENGSAEFTYAQSPLSYSLLNADQMVQIANGTLVNHENINSLPAGNYSVKFTFSNGYIAEEVFEIGGSAAVNLLNNENQIFEAGLTTSLEALTNANQVEWIFEDGSILSGNPVAHSFTTVGQHWLTCNAQLNDCQQSNTFKVEVVNPSGIKTSQANGFSAMVIYNTMIVNVDQNLAKQATLHIYSADGKLLWEKPVQLLVGENRFDLPTFSEQILFARIFTTENQQVIKFNTKK